MDITDVDCPVTFVKVQVALEELQIGDLLEIRINAGRAHERVPHTMRCVGHEIVSDTDNGDDTFTVVLKKGV